MSRIVFLGDLHGNIVATEAMAKTIEKIAPDEVWFLGDAVGKGPSNRETCDWVKEHCDHFLKGNWDEWIIESYLKREDKHSRYATENRFYYEQLGEERLMWLRSLPYEDEILISGLRIRLIHGRPVDQLYQGYDPDEKMKEGFHLRGQPSSVCEISSRRICCKYRKRGKQYRGAACACAPGGRRAGKRRKITDLLYNPIRSVR